MGLFGNKKSSNPPENAKLLTTGAMMFKMNNFRPQELKVKDTDKAAYILESFWDVKDHDSTIELVKEFLTLNDSHRLDELLKSQSFSSAQNNMLNDMSDYMTQIKRYGLHKGEKPTRGQVDSVQTTVAWDIERAGFIARLALSCGYLSDDETARILTTTHQLAEKYFRDWIDYSISYLKARSLVMADSDPHDMNLIWTNSLLLEEKNWGDVWSWSPLS